MVLDKAHPSGVIIKPSQTQGLKTQDFSYHLLISSDVNINKLNSNTYGSLKHIPIPRL